MQDVHTVRIGSRVKVGRFLPNGVGLHPNAGAVGRVYDLFNGKALLLVGERYILVSIGCLETGPEEEVSWPEASRFRQSTRVTSQKVTLAAELLEEIDRDIEALRKASALNKRQEERMSQLLRLAAELRDYIGK